MTLWNLTQRTYLVRIRQIVHSQGSRHDRLFAAHDRNFVGGVDCELQGVARIEAEGNA